MVHWSNPSPPRKVRASLLENPARPQDQPLRTISTSPRPNKRIFTAPTAGAVDEPAEVAPSLSSPPSFSLPQPTPSRSRLFLPRELRRACRCPPLWAGTGTLGEFVGGGRRRRAALVAGERKTGERATRVRPRRARRPREAKGLTRANCKFTRSHITHL